MYERGRVSEREVERDGGGKRGWDRVGEVEIEGGDT